MQRPQRNFIQRLRPVSLVAVALLVTQPWWFKFQIAYKLAPSLWLVYAGSLVIGLGWLVAAYWHDARDARSPGLVDLHYLGALAASVAAGLALMTWYEPIYTHARIAIQRGAMERVVDGASDCPAASSCIRDASGAVFFIWGAMDDLRTGVCHDATGETLALARATRASLDASQAPNRQRFGGAITRGEALGGPWYRCSVRRLASA